MAFQLDFSEFRNDGEGRFSIFYQLGLCFLKDLDVSFIGGFEGLSAEVTFELLSDLVEFVVGVIDGYEGVKVTYKVESAFRGYDFTFETVSVILVLGVHDPCLGRAWEHP